jgi:hypothetical protein
VIVTSALFLLGAEKWSPYSMNSVVECAQLGEKVFICSLLRRDTSSVWKRRCSQVVSHDHKRDSALAHIFTRKCPLPCRARLGGGTAAHPSEHCGKKQLRAVEPHHMRVLRPA